MIEPVRYAVFLFPNAQTELGEALSPYLRDGPSGKHVLCSEIDAAGPLFEMTVHSLDAQGAAHDILLMVPVAMVKLVIAVQQGSHFGFARRSAERRSATVAAVTPATDPEPG